MPWDGYFGKTATGYTNENGQGVDAVGILPFYSLTQVRK